MPSTAVGLFKDRNLADQVIRAIEGLGFLRNEVRRVEEPRHFEVSGVMSFPRLDFEAHLERGLKRIGATEAQAHDYIEGLRRGETVIFATDPDEKKVRAAADLMSRHSAGEVGEGRGPQPSVAVGVGAAPPPPQRLDLAGRVNQAPQAGNRYFSW